jgi:hypothetical protein
MITADYDLVPDDPNGYRAALIEAFRLRGIRPEGVRSYAEEALRWLPPEVLTGKAPARCEGLIFDPFNAPSEAQQEANATTLSQFGAANAEALGLTPGWPVQAHSFHPVYRTSPAGRLQIEVITELTQQIPDVRLDPHDENSPTFTFRGGSTLILSQEGDVRYTIRKSLRQDNAQNVRLQRQREYYQQLDANVAQAAYLAAALDFRPMSFDLIHRGY